jgi:hypothetical protein
MSKQKKPDKPPFVCLLGIDPKTVQKCNVLECSTCGWEAAEAERRREYISKYGLTLCAGGLRRLVIKKENNEMATPYKECPFCGAHLDSGETCDCREEADNDDEKSKERTKDNDGN